MGEERGFERAEALLRRVEASSGAAECHGFLAGCLCAVGPAGLETGLGQLLGKAPAVPEPALKAARDFLQETLAQDRAQLEQAPQAFEPLLPGAECAPRERVAALRDWCAGFLGGLGYLEQPAYAALAIELQEFLRDLTQITRVDEGTAEADDAEADLAALSDYVRAGVMRLYADLRRRV